MKNKYENAKFWCTRDFYSACVLRALDFPLRRLIRNKGNVVTFEFVDSKNKAEQVIKDYWDRKIQLNDARALVDAISELKTRIHGGQHSE